MSATRPRELEEQVRALGTKAAELYAIAKHLPEPYRTAFELGHGSTSGGELSGVTTQVSQSDPAGEAVVADHRDILRSVCASVAASLAEAVAHLEDLIKSISAAENRLTGKKGVLRAAGAWDFVEAAQIEKGMKGATF